MLCLVFSVYFGFEIGLIMLVTGFLTTFDFGFFFPKVNGLMILFTGFLIILEVFPKRSFDAFLSAVLLVGALVSLMFLVVVVVGFNVVRAVFLIPVVNGLQILFTGLLKTLEVFLRRMAGFVVVALVVVGGVVVVNVVLLAGFFLLILDVVL